MSIDYVRLDQSLSSVVARLTPDHIKADSSSLYKYFEAKREKAWESMVDVQTKNAKAFNRAAVLGVGGGLVAVGLLVAGGSAALPAAAVMSFGSAGYLAARSIANKMRLATAETAMQRGQDLLDEPFDEAMRASFASEQRGGLLTRLYRHVGDALQGYERQVAGIIDKIDAVGLSGPANRQKIKEILNEGMSPGLEEYMRRASSDKFSKAAHLMSRLTTRAQLERLASGSPAQAPRADDRVFNGWVAAPAVDADFLKSLGVELAGYDYANQHFRVRATPEAMESLRVFENCYAMALEPSSRVVLESAVHGAAGGSAMSYESLSRAELVGLREAVLFDVAQNGADRAAATTRDLVLTSISSEFERRPAEANTRRLGQAEPQLERLALGSSAQAPRADDRVFNGWVAAPAVDADFLKSLGVELAGYDHANQHFRVRAMPEAMESLRVFENCYAMALEPSSRAVLDSAVNGAAGGSTMSYESLSRAELVGLREAILFEMAENMAESASGTTREFVLTNISSEFERRLAEANTRRLGQAEPQVDAGPLLSGLGH